MAAGAIPPPQFFERRRHLSIFCLSIFASRQWHPRGHPKNTIASITLLDGRCAQARPLGDRSLPKDI